MSNLKWKHQSPKKQLENMIQIYGPSSISDYNKGGLALWLEKDLNRSTLFGMPNCFSELLIRDETIKHRCPAPHEDFMYSYVLVDIAPNILPIINSISGSVSYDPLKKFLSARCGNLAANIATLKLATDVLTDQVPQEYYDQGLANLYGTLIKATSDEANVVQFYQDLCENLATLGHVEITDYWIGAFNQDCGDPAPEFQWYSVCDKADKLNIKVQKGGNKSDKPKRRKSDKPSKKGQRGGRKKNLMINLINLENKKEFRK